MTELDNVLEDIREGSCQREAALFLEPVRHRQRLVMNVDLRSPNDCPFTPVFYVGNDARILRGVLFFLTTLSTILEIKEYFTTIINRAVLRNYSPQLAQEILQNFEALQLISDDPDGLLHQTSSSAPSSSDCSSDQEGVCGVCNQPTQGSVCSSCKAEGQLARRDDHC